jgi:hypothetical protein
MRLALLTAIAASLWLAAPATAQTGELRTLQPDRLPGMCIVMIGPSAEAISQPCTGAANEKFLMPGAEGGPIRYGERCLVPRGSGNYPPLVAADCDGSPAQTWKMGEVGELRSGEGRCISLLGASSRTGELVFAGECPKDGEGQAWRVRPVDATNVIDASLESAVRPGQCIGYDTGLQLYPCTDAYRQVMSFDEKALGQIRMMSSCLSGGYIFGALQLGDCWDMPQQKWMLMEGGRVANATGDCITVSPENGRDVLRTSACGSAAEQQWIVRRPGAKPVPVEQIPTVSTLQHKQLPGMCMSLTGRDGESESRPCDGSALQDFQFPGAEGGPIRHAENCLAPHGQGLYPQLVAARCDGSPAQTWTMTAEGEVRNAGGRCLSLLGSSSRSGERIYAGECPVNLPAHHWSAVAVDPMLARPVNALVESRARAGMCVGHDGALHLVPCAERLGRVFSFDRSGPTQLRLMGSCMAGGFVFDGIALGQCWDLPPQKWSETPDGELVSGDGKCLTVVSDEGQDVLRGLACRAIPEQQWTIREVS